MTALDDSIDLLEDLDGEISVILKKLSELKPNDDLVIRCAYSVGSDIRNTNRLQNYLNKLREYGYDIGNGNCEYGFKMPKPNKREVLKINDPMRSRKLVIFRRR